MPLMRFHRPAHTFGEEFCRYHRESTPSAEFSEFTRWLASSICTGLAEELAAPLAVLALRLPPPPRATQHVILRVGAML